MILKLATLALALGAASSAAGVSSRSSFAAWLDAEAAKSVDAIIANVDPPSAPPGFVLASPSKTDPNYYFHWTRDAALTMAVLVDVAQAAPDSRIRTRIAAQWGTR